MYKRIVQLSQGYDGIIDLIHAARYSEELFLFYDKKVFSKRKFAHSLHQMNSSSLLRTMLAFLIKETWKTPRLAAILDFNELGRLGVNKANFGQQPCHCRLGESRFGFWRTRVDFLEIFTSFNLKMMTLCNKTWLTAF